MIYFDKVTKKYGDLKAIDEVSFTVEPGEFVSVVGHSGAGKSTLLKMLLAEEKPTSGNIFFESLDIHCLGKKDIPCLRRKIGSVFQDYRLLPHKTAFENIAFIMEAAGRTDDEIASDVPHILELVGLSHKMWSFPHEMSGGEKQRIAIARAIVNQPEILLTDEPTANLDPINTMEIIEILKKINEIGTTVILATHNKNLVDALEKRVLTLENGKLIRDDKKGRYVI